MSIVHKSTIHCGPVFLKAITTWSSGDLTNTQILCLQCLEGLRYNPSFPHLAACLYYLAFCAKDGNSTEYADDVIECLQNKCSANAFKFNLPWPLLESFNGTSKSFFELVDKSYSNEIAEDGLIVFPTSWSDLNGDGDGGIYADGEYLVAPPAWYHHSYNCLTAENYESIALFCLDMGLRELGVAFAVRAHQESKRRESPDIYSIDCSEALTPSHILSNGDTPTPSTSSSSNSDSSCSQSPKQLPNLSLPLLQHLNLPVNLLPDEDEDTDMIFSVRTSQNHHPQQSKVSKQISDPKSYEIATTVRRRIRGSILKSPSPFFLQNTDDPDSLAQSLLLSNCASGESSRCESPSSVEPGNPLSPKKRVRFSLSSSHPPPHLEAQFGGRSNSQRLQDMARRRSFRYHRRCINDQELDGDDDEDSVGAFDRLVGIFWPDGGRFRWCFWGGEGEMLHDFSFHRFGRCVGDVTAFLGCLVALLLFCLLFLALVVCIPLTWFAVDGNAGVTTGTCIRLLNAFGLHALLAK
nr:hypothetical transcript [Hymenolepis microstoma]